MHKDDPNTKTSTKNYLDRDGTGQSIEVFEQLPNPDLVPGVPVLLPQNVIRREAVQDAGPALRRSLDQQLALRGRVLGGVEEPLEGTRPRLPQGDRHRRVVHSRPQADRLPRPVDLSRAVVRRGEGGGDRDCVGRAGFHGQMGAPVSPFLDDRRERESELQAIKQ